LFVLVFALTYVYAKDNGNITYNLSAEQIAPDTYLVEGATEHFNSVNGGNIHNSAFFITTKGVVVIDTGPSARYGEEFRKLIQSITNEPITQVYLTHHHPDHILGNQAFKEIPIAARATTIHATREHGDGFTDAMYFILGIWMKGTELIVPTQSVEDGTVDFGNHQIQLIGLEGHTEGDLVIFDETTGVLFTGDLVFHNRAPATSQANLPNWLESLSRLDDLPMRVLVPGHGPITNNKTPIKQTRDYLLWLDKTLQTSAQQGLDMLEVSDLPIADEFKTLRVLPEEYRRSVSHLYPKYEEQSFQSLN